MAGNKRVVVQVWVGLVDAVDLGKLTGAKSFLVVEAPQSLEESLAT